MRVHCEKCSNWASINPGPSDTTYTCPSCEATVNIPERYQRFGAMGMACGGVVGLVPAALVVMAMMSAGPDPDGPKGRERGYAIIFVPLLVIAAVGGVGWVIGAAVGLATGNGEERKKLLTTVGILAAFAAFMGLLFVFIHFTSGPGSR